MTDHAELLDSIIGSRRTCLQMDPERPVDPGLVEALCRAAAWAPYHRRTEPWRFAAFTGAGRGRLGDTIADVMAADGADPAKVAKTRGKYLRAPLMLLVGSAAGPDATTTAENRDATAAAVQNLLLAATARGLGSFWSSVARPEAPELLELCGFEPGTFVVAAIYLGHPTGECAAPSRSEATVNWVG